jgi:hypothetical protein
MVWIAAIVVLILLVASVGFRKFFFGAVGIIIVIGLAAYFYIQNQNENEERRAKTLIKPYELKFEDFRLGTKQYSSYPEITGRVINNSSKYSLSELALKITFRDCPKAAKPGDCVTIGESTKNIHLNVPPGQARNFAETVYASEHETKAKGSLEWDYQVTTIKGRQ